MAKDRFIFLHIPKTAGTTVHTLLEQNFPCSEMLSTTRAEDAFEQVRRVDARLLANLRLVKGHLPYGIDKFLPGNWRYVTFLRDPVARVMSSYRYILTQRGSEDFRAIGGGQLDLSEVVSHRLLRDNVQTRYLLGGEYLTRRPLRELDDNCVAVAIERLRGFAFCGTVERFDESCGILCALIGLKDTRYVKKNESRQSSHRSLHDGTRELIAQREAYDAALYRYAQRQLADTVNRFAVEQKSVATVPRETSKSTAYAVRLDLKRIWCRLAWLLRGDRTLLG